MEDEDYFKFSDDILLTTTEKLQFRDTALYIYSSADGQLDLVADTEIQIAATTVDINGNVDVCGTLTVAGAVDFGDSNNENNESIQFLEYQLIDSILYPSIITSNENTIPSIDISLGSSVRFREGFLFNEGGKAHLEILFNYSVGIGEHTNLLDEVKRWTKELAEAEEGLATLEENF